MDHLRYFMLISLIYSKLDFLIFLKTTKVCFVQKLNTRRHLLNVICIRVCYCGNQCLITGLYLRMYFRP